MASSFRAGRRTGPPAGRARSIPTTSGCMTTAPAARTSTAPSPTQRLLGTPRQHPDQLRQLRRGDGCRDRHQSPLSQHRVHRTLRSLPGRIIDHARAAGIDCTRMAVTASLAMEQLRVARDSVTDPTVSSWSPGRLDVFWVARRVVDAEVLQRRLVRAAQPRRSMGRSTDRGLVEQPTGSTSSVKGAGGTLQHYWWDGRAGTAPKSWRPAWRAPRP